MSHRVIARRLTKGAAALKRVRPEADDNFAAGAELPQAKGECDCTGCSPIAYYVQRGRGRGRRAQAAMGIRRPEEQKVAPHELPVQTPWVFLRDVLDGTSGYFGGGAGYAEDCVPIKFGSPAFRTVNERALQIGALPGRNVKPCFYSSGSPVTELGGPSSLRSFMSTACDLEHCK
jgi:hypothetical protein